MPEQKDEPVKRRELQQAHEELKNEFFTQFNEWKNKIEPYLEKFDDLPSDFQEQWDRINEKVDELETQKERLRKQYEVQKESGRREYGEKVQKHHDAFMAFIRKGERGMDREKRQFLQQKALATDDDTQGGYIVPDNMADDIIQKRRAFSPIRSLAEVVTISEGDSFKIPKEGDTEMESGWTSERESRSETQTTDFEMLDIPVHELYAKPHVTRQMLADTAFDVEAWLRRKVSSKFTREEGAQFVDGDGSGKPEGILQNGDIKTVNSGKSSALTYQGLLDLIYDIEIEEYVRNASMLMNRKTLGDIRGLTDSNDMPIWQPGLSDDDPPSILGFPYETATDMPTVSSNANAIVFGDFEIAYTIVDRQGMNLIRDPYSSKPFIEYEWFTRVGGQVTQEDALRIHVISN